jgi:hypothetical protein
MAKLPNDVKVVSVEGPLDSGKPSKPKFRTARHNGKSVRLRVVDADSPTFAADFQASFAANVRRARAENRALIED